MLSKEEELRLVSLAQAGSVEARNSLIEHLLPIIQKIVMCSCRGRERRFWNEHLGAGIEGFVRALKTYDPSRGLRLSTHMTLAIRGEVMDSIRRCRAIIRIPRPSMLKGLSEKAQAKAASAKKPVNIDHLREEDNNFDLEDPGAKDPNAHESDYRLDVVQKVLSVLPSRTRGMINLWTYGHTMAEISVMYGVTECRVSQLIQEARATIRDRILLAKSA